jgi:hypothetical protein
VRTDCGPNRAGRLPPLESTTPAGPLGWLAQDQGARSLVREAPVPCRSDPRDGSDGIVCETDRSVKRTLGVRGNCFRC